MEIFFCTSVLCDWNGYEGELAGGDCPDCGEDVVSRDDQTEEDTDDE